MRNILSFLRRFPTGRKRLVLCFVLQFILSWASLINAEVMRTGTLAIEKRELTLLWMTGFWIVTAIVINIVFAYFAKILLRSATLQYEHEIQSKILNQLMRMKKIEFSKYSTGEITTTIINNVTDAVSNSVDCIYGVFSGSIIILACIVYMALIDWRIMLTIVMSQLVIRFCLKLFENKVRKITAEKIKAEKTGNSILFEMLRSMLTIRAGRHEVYFNHELKKRENVILDTKVRSHLWQNGQFEFIWTTSKVVEYLLIYGFGGILVCIGKADYSTVFSFAFVLECMVDGLNTLGNGLNGKSVAIASIASVENLLSSQHMEDESQKMIDEGPFAIRAENVSFSYGEKKILDNVNFTIKPGEKIMITGPNGGGKSTLLALLAGLYRPDSGKLFYGSEDTACINLDSLSGSYRYICQQNDLLDGTVCENIALSKKYDIKKCEHVLKKVNLDNCCQNSPVALSQGEIQRVNIGRALYCADSAQLLLGDEIFSNVDCTNADHIALEIVKQYAEKTILMVCHEEMNISFDRIFHVDNGHIIVTERGVQNETE